MVFVCYCFFPSTVHMHFVFVCVTVRWTWENFYYSDMFVAFLLDKSKRCYTTTQTQTKTQSLHAQCVCCCSFLITLLYKPDMYMKMIVLDISVYFLPRMDSCCLVKKLHGASWRRLCLDWRDKSQIQVHLRSTTSGRHKASSSMNWCLSVNNIS